MQSSLTSAETSRIAKISSDVFDNPDPFRSPKAKSTALVPLGGTIILGDTGNDSSGAGSLTTSISAPNHALVSSDSSARPRNQRIIRSSTKAVARPVIRRESVSKT